jgi:hypothetical protein
MNGSQLRDEGVDRNLAARGEEDYATIAREVIDALIETEEVFNADTVTHRMPAGIARSHQNILPSIFNTYRRQGKIEVVGYTQSMRPSRRGGVIRQWKAVPVEWRRQQ